MLTKSIFKAYDVRGLYPQDVNEASVRIITRALVDIWKPGEIIIAHDGRHGSALLAKTVEAEVLTLSKNLNKKFTVVFVGLATTPMFYFLVNHYAASGGAMITASHNPKEYNGMKAVKEYALPLTGTELLSIIEEKNYGL